MKSRILLVSPLSDNESLWVTGNEGPDVRNNIAPLGLATIAGLTPDEFEVDIWDELVHGAIDDSTRFRRSYDLVGITGYKAHLPRCRDVAAVFRRRGLPVVLGGPGVSATPDDYRDCFDILFIGEAERTWPQFLEDWKRGEHRAEYRQIEKFDLAESPLPDWSPIAHDLDKYAFGSVQTTRGCPFDCEFCDVIYLYGRRQRHKPVEQVLEEVRAMQRLGMSSIFFCDDEFIGDPRYAKQLLEALIPLNNSFDRPLLFSTQLTMNLSKSDELLQLMADANFDLVFIGIETPNKESLKETSKYQNVRKDLVGDVHKVLSYGISIRAGAIVGFDHDDQDIFDMQYDFFQQAYIPSVAINMLKAPWGTRLWTRLRQEGRVVSIPLTVRAELGHPRSYTTILPKRLTRVQLMQGYRSLLERICTWESFADRACGFVSTVKRTPQPLIDAPPKVDEERLRASLKGQDTNGQLDRVLAATREMAPLFMGRMQALIIQHAMYRDSICKLLPQLDRQIELEGSGKLRFEVDKSAIPIPAAFRSGFKTIFPQVYRRLYINLNDKEQVAAAVVDVFVDFLVRWGHGFTGMEDHHHTFLAEICDRACAMFNGEPPEAFVPVADNNGEIPDAKRLRLDDDVLKNVEQILARVARGEAGSELALAN